MVRAYRDILGIIGIALSYVLFNYLHKLKIEMASCRSKFLVKTNFCTN